MGRSVIVGLRCRRDLELSSELAHPVGQEVLLPDPLDVLGVHNAAMPNIASILKAEISRVARKQIRSETLTLKKAISAYRSEIATLKRRAQALEQALRQVDRSSRNSGRPVEHGIPEKTPRFSAKGLASHRRRLGLTVLEVGLLVGASGKSVYLWERGEARPRASHLAAIAALRSLGKKRAAQIVDSRREFNQA
jgi:DNA-binding transcriptional regulator YiaG